LAAQLARPSYATCFVVGTDFMGYRLSALHRQLQPGAQSAVVQNALNIELSEGVQHGVGPVQTNIAAASAGCPEGWLGLKDSVVDADQAKLREQLSTNSQHQTLSPLTDSTSTVLKHMKRVNASRKPLFSASLLEDCKTRIALGMETVCMTYILYKLDHEIVPMASLIGKRRAIEALRLAIKAKGGTFGDSVGNFCAELVKPSFQADTDE